MNFTHQRNYRRRGNRYTEFFLSEIEERLRFWMPPDAIFRLVSPLLGPGSGLLKSSLSLLAILLAFCKLDVFRRTDGEASTPLSLAAALIGFCSMITGCWYLPTAFQCSRCAFSEPRIFSLASALSASIWFSI